MRWAVAPVWSARQRTWFGCALAAHLVAFGAVAAERQSDVAQAADAEPRQNEAVAYYNYESPHSNPIALLPDGSLVYVANTPADTVDVIDAATGAIVARVHVGIDPVAIAVRPDGKEVWVSNHVSDSVSVIGTAR